MNIIDPDANIIQGAALNVISRSLGSPLLGTATRVLAATSTAAGSTIQAASLAAQPDVARNITATVGGTAGNVTAVSVVINGTDNSGHAISETLPAFTAASTGIVTGSKAFASITSVVLPTVGASTTVSIGTSSKLGIPRRLSRDTIMDAYLNGVRESTRPTVAFDIVNLCNNTVTLNSALNGNPVLLDYRAP